MNDLAPGLVWIERVMGPAARVVRVAAWPPSSTTMHRIEVVPRDRASRSLVLRRYHDAERLAHDPWYVPAHEALALGLLADVAIPAPRLHAADLEAASCDVPALLESWLPGAPAWRPDDLDGYLGRAAEMLVALHTAGVPCGALPRYAPYEDASRLVSPRFSTRPGLWERVAHLLDGPWPAHRETFIHRDYHPGNLLWDGARVLGVVDWATAACGPPGVDLARMRLNLASRRGGEAADRFAARYVAAGGDPAARDPFWDLLDAADALPRDPAIPFGGSLARFEDYVERLLAECGGRRTR